MFSLSLLSSLPFSSVPGGDRFHPLGLGGRKAPWSLVGEESQPPRRERPKYTRVVSMGRSGATSKKTRRLLLKGFHLGGRVAAAPRGSQIPPPILCTGPSQSHFFRAPRLFRVSWAWVSCCCSLWRVLSLEARFRWPCISSTMARWPGVL